ncbi:Tyrosine phosphatase type IVA [Fasciola hepatica]|uniref:Protein tyrosine phosphatase type IVA 3 n=1 Tax=Fasciola hepatica TaxID=6192 RepID=A0A4E0R4K8_FASHE|nr:Tyrosine phosphatase type IVA [Fasciola hepatica]
MSVLAPRTTSLAVTPSVSGQRDSVRLSRDCLRPKLSRQLQEPHVTLIEYKNARFLITDQPSPTNMEHFIIDLEFDDGAPPPDAVIEKWFHLITELWQTHPGSCVAVHCRAGLGRAPALVTVALIELGLPYDEAIEMIRSRRTGALNAKQIQYLKNFRPRKRLRLKNQPDRCQIL